MEELLETRLQTMAGRKPVNERIALIDEKIKKKQDEIGGTERKAAASRHHEIRYG